MITCIAIWTLPTSLTNLFWICDTKIKTFSLVTPELDDVCVISASVKNLKTACCTYFKILTAFLIL